MKGLIVSLLVFMVGAGSVHGQSEGAALEKSSKDSKATVYFLRFPEFPHSRINPIVYSNDVELAHIDSGRFFRVKLEAGDYTFSVDEHKLPLTLKSGETYYVQVEMKYGLFKGKGRPVLMDQQLGAAIIKQAKLKPLKSKMVLNRAIVVNDEKKK